MTVERMLAVLIAAAITLGAPAHARAATCKSACASIKAGAGKQAAADYRSCKLSCSTATKPGQCRRDCMKALTAAQRAAKTSLLSCRQSCTAAISCDQQCAAPFYACLDPIGSSELQCASSCAVGARDSAGACVNASDPQACLLQVAAQMTTCAAGCAMTGAAAIDACRATFGTCLQSCPAPACQDACMGSTLRCLTPVRRDADTCAANCVASGFQAGASCLGQADPRACFAAAAQQFTQCGQGCANDARTAVRACGSDTSGCVNQCEPPAGCRDQCAASGQDCLVNGVVDALKTCGKDCATSLSQSVLACLKQTDVAGCLLKLVPQAQTCAEGCKSAAYAAGDACRVGFESCVGACPADTCRDGCAGSVESCVSTLFGNADTCATGCATAALGSGAGCFFRSDPGACFASVGVRLAACGLGCENTALNTGDQCKETFVSCESSCGN